MPVNVGNGSNVTTPVTGSTVYVPSFGTTSVVCVQLFGVWTGLMPHNFTVVATSGALAAPAVSFANGLIVWFVSYVPVEMSFVAAGGGGTIGVNVLVAV